MPSFDELDLRSPDEPEPEPDFPGSRGTPPPPLGLVAVASALLVAAALGYWWLRMRQPAAPVPVASATPLPVPTAAASPTPRPTPLDLPPLDASDALVRQLARGLTADPLFASWLGAPNLLRRLTAAAVNVAEGASPASHLGFLAPAGSFAVTQRAGGLVVDPRSHERYDALARSVASLDPAACARVYEQLEPLFDVAYRELGYPGKPFRAVLLRGLAAIADAPVVEGELAVRPVRRATLVYELVDPELEALSPARKQLLRMGPANTRRVQAALRAFASALGSSGSEAHPSGGGAS